MAKSGTGTKKKKKTTTAARSAQKKKTQQKQPPQQKRSGREVIGYFMLGLAVLVMYFLVAGIAGASNVGVASILKGLAGVLCYLLPLVLGWLGYKIVISEDRGARGFNDIALRIFLVLLTASFAHVFCVRSICAKMNFSSFSNFLYYSWQEQAGGGVLGALLLWPIYWTLGMDEFGTGLILVLLIGGDLVLMNKISPKNITRRVQDRYKETRDNIQKQINEKWTSGRDSDLRHVSEKPQDEDFDLFDDKEMPRQRRKKPQGDDFDLFGDEDMSRQHHTKQKRPNKFPRHMVINKVEPTLPGEPKPQPAKTGEEEPFTPDVPDILNGRRVRKKNPEQVNDIHIEEPVIPTRKPRNTAATKPANGSPIEQPIPVHQDPISQEEPAGKENEPKEVEMEDNKIKETNPDELDIYNTPSDEDIDKIPEIDEEPLPEFPMPEPAKPEPVPTIRIEEPAPQKSAQAPESAPAQPEPEPYNYPPIDLLRPATAQQTHNQSSMDQDKGKRLVEALASFGIAVTLVGIAHGPTVTRFELSPAPGVKVSRITALADDIALNLAAVSVRIEAPIPGKAAVGVEVPNDVVETVPIRDVLESDAARRNASRLAAALGRDNAGRYILCDLSKMPHLLIAGQTGSGKSVCINCIICSILYRATPEEVRMILIDPKVVELSVYNGIPHLLVPVVTDPKKAAGVLEWAVQEMTLRYKKFADTGTRDIKGFNQHRPEGEPFMPQIVIIIDELADLMMVAASDVEDAICRLAQLARAAGIYLVIATQRPSVNVITGIIKANIPSRIAFTVASQVDSRTILDFGGAEKLLGRGDMLYYPSGIGKPWRAQGAWVSDDEVHQIVDYIRSRHTASYNEDVIEHLENCGRNDAEKEQVAEEFDALLPDAVEIIVEMGQASTSMLQRRMRIGYARAGRLIDEMEKRHIIGPGEGSKPRTVLMTREQFKQMYSGGTEQHE